MKNIPLIIILLLLLTACKSRKVAIVKSDVTTSTALTSIVKKDSLTIDTGKVRIDTKVAKNIRDSVEITLVPDSGSIQQIHIATGGEFFYMGRAKAITYKKAVNDNSLIDESLQENKAEITRTTIADSSTQQQTMHQITKNKTIDAKASYNWIWIGIAIFVIVGGYLFLKFKL